MAMVSAIREAEPCCGGGEYQLAAAGNVRAKSGQGVTRRRPAAAASGGLVLSPALPRFTGTLMPRHLALIDHAREHRIRVGLSTNRCDRPAAEAAVRRAYTSAGLSEPPLMIWMDSPLGGVLAHEAVSHLLGQSPGTSAGRRQRQLDDRLRERFRSEFGNQLRIQLRDELQTKLQDVVWDEPRGDLGHRPQDELRDHLWSQFYAQMLSQLRAKLGSGPANQLSAQLASRLDVPLLRHLRGPLLDSRLHADLRTRLDAEFLSGIWNHLGPWSEGFGLAFHTAALIIARLPANDRLEALTTAMDTVGWWWPMRGAVILTDRPTHLHVGLANEGGGPHGETGPALRYADGYDLTGEEPT
jgi:hypothetical protein